MLTVCIRCGNIKKNVVGSCQVCHFLPKSDVDKAKSIILSTAYEIDGEYKGKTIEELRSIANSIASGNPYTFDMAELDSVVKYAKDVSSITAKELIIDGVRWLFPPIIILVLLYLIVFLNK